MFDTRGDCYHPPVYEMLPGRRAADGAVITYAELQRRCRLLEPLELISRRRLAFFVKVVERPSCQLARQSLWMEVAPSDRVRRVSGRERSSYLNAIDLDMRYLHSGSTARKSLDGLLAMARRQGLSEVGKYLKTLKPDTMRIGCQLRLVSARQRDIPCPEMGCQAMFAEQKEVNRHVRRSHLPTAPVVESLQQLPTSAVSTGGQSPAKTIEGLLSCPVAGCSRVFKTHGWLGRHVKSNHPGECEAAPVNPNIPPAVQVTAVGPTPLPNPAIGRGRRRAVLGMVGAVTGTGNRTLPAPVGSSANKDPVLMPGDGHGGSQGTVRDAAPMRREEMGGGY